MISANRCLCALGAAAILVVAGCGSTSAAPPPGTLAVFAAGRLLTRVAVPAAAAPTAEARAVVRRLPARLVVRRGRATIHFAVSRAGAAAAAERALAARRPQVVVPARPVSAAVALRPVQQLLHNDCEATALSMVLAAAGVDVSQLRLQRQLPVSGPLDPEPLPGTRLLRWGDPERGFVGRADGSGSDGGFGVYEPPVRALALRHGVRLVDLRGRSLAAVRAHVLAGLPVLAWVGLAAGPYMTWLTPSGRKLTVNLNEHAIVLVGAGPGYVLVNDPLSGTRVRWSDALFSRRWRRLGQRALGLPGP